MKTYDEALATFRSTKPEAFNRLSASREIVAEIYNHPETRRFLSAIVNAWNISVKDLPEPVLDVIIEVFTNGILMGIEMERQDCATAAMETQR